MPNFRAGVLAVLFMFAAAAVYPQCFPPAPPTIVFAPSGSVAIGQTYAIDWSDTTGGDGSYIIERSTSSRFDVAVQQQRTGGLAASFVSGGEGLYYHRVRAVAACDVTKESANSATSAVTVVTGPPVVVITVHPQATIVSIGDSLSDARAAMTLENVSHVPVTVALTTEAIGSSAFFAVNDPSGGNVSQLPLSPGVPKPIEIRFNGVSTSSGATFQGLIAVRGISAPLPVTPYAYVNLKIGSSTDFIHPSFRVGGIASEFASFPGWGAIVPDNMRPPLGVEIVNPGNTPLEVAGEIAPEGWLIPNAGWNAAAIPPKSSIQVDLFTDRSRANRNSPLPRYTYFTVRTKAGFTARLLVQDNDVQSQTIGTLPPVSPVTQSFILVWVTDFDVSSPGQTEILRTRARISNVSSTAVKADVFFIPALGFANEVNRTTLIIPPNDVVVFSDVLRQLFTSSFPRRYGSLEIRTDAQDAHFLTVNATTYVQLPQGEITYGLPVVLRGEGARTSDVPHAIAGIALTSAEQMLLSFVETSRVNSAVVTASLFDKNGVRIGNPVTIALVPAQWYSVYLQNASMFGTPQEVDRGAHIEFSVQGQGTVTGLAQVSQQSVSHGVVYTAYVGGPFLRSSSAKIREQALTLPKTYAVLGATNEPATLGIYTTFLGVNAPGQAADLTFSYLSAGQLSKVAVRLTVPSGKSIEFSNILDQLFGIPTTALSRGTILIDSTSPVEIYGGVNLSGFLVGNLPVISTASEALTSAVAGYQRPIYFDGLEQAIDPTIGSRWSLSLTELYNVPATVTVRLYEPGNRTSPIAEADVSLVGHEQKILDPIFTALGLDQADRRKDRTNVQVVVVPKYGSGVVAAVAIGYDNVTGVTTRYVLGPNGGVPATGVSKVAEVPPPTIPPRRRSAHH